VVAKVKEFVALMETGMGKRPKVIRSDNGGEFINRELDEFYRAKGIRRNTTVPYTPQQNGIAERKNRFLIEMTRCLLLDANLDKRYWGEAIQTAAYIQNRTPNSSIQGEIPYARWFDAIPKYDNLKIFGCRAYAHVPSQKRTKLDKKAVPLVFVSYAQESKGFRLLNPSDNTILLSRDVKFDERYDVSTQVEVPESKATPNPDENESIQEISFNSCKCNDDSAGDEIDVAEEIELRRSRRVNFGVPAQRYSPDIAGVTSSVVKEPMTYEEAVKSSNSAKWIDAMDNEFESLIKNETWELVTLPEGRKPIGCKWVYKAKEDANGNVVRFKARLVATGFSQKFGEDYDLVFAPVVKQTTMRLMLTVAGSMGYNVEHLDIKTAFLNGDLDETIYMKQPVGYTKTGQEHLVCKLRRSLYGLKQAARSWNLKIDGVIKKLGFISSKSDPCFSTKMIGQKPMYLLVYVDDIIIGFDQQAEIANVFRKLSAEFEVVSLGAVKHFLGLEVIQDSNGIFSIGQQGYINRTKKKGKSLSDRSWIHENH
jgi:hypothetical protein